MCGIFGVVSERPVTDEVLGRAEALQRHRGPDAQGRMVLPLGTLHVGLAHQRLAIIDLSASGEQPMRSPSDNSLIIFNGEIYNYVELRAELVAAGVRFRTQTDTEVVAAACEHYGIEGALGRLNGMWALAWLDLRAARLVLARDRFGKKPLYLAEGQHGLAFGSEIKTLVGALGLRCPVRPEAVAAFLGASQVDFDDTTFFAGIIKLPAGAYAIVEGRGAPVPVVRRYYDLAVRAPVARTLAEAVDETRALLDDAVRIRLRSDVPLGVLLSGGLDSSAIAASAVRQLGGAPLVSLSAVSSDRLSDESEFSRRVGHHLGLDIREVTLDLVPGQSAQLIREVTQQNDEPIGGFSCVAQYLLMQRARELGITVLLSGQGADESFCGYRKYAGFEVLSRLRHGRPVAAARLLAGFLWQGTLLARLNPADAARYLPRWARSSLPAVSGPALQGLALPAIGFAGEDLRQRQVADVLHYSVPALTHWEDRNSMAWSREVRDPFLDYRLVELGVGMPAEWKLRQGFTKAVLREAVRDRLPESIAFRRDKRGFATPEIRLLCGELRPWLESLASREARIVRRGFVEPQAVAARCAEFWARPGRRVASRELFQLLSLESWLETYEDVLGS